MELTKFNNEIVKVININNTPYFFGSQIATFLEYARPGNALKTFVSPENKIHVLNTNPSLRIMINEIGVYELIFGSKMPMAKQFRILVYGTILPAFRMNLLPVQPVIADVLPVIADVLPTTKPIGN